jgi:NADPH:quinone reductase-like Zn-dependent oxidoreductase
MRAAVVTRYGSPEVVAVVERPDPVPRPAEVLVRVDSVAVTSGDARIRAARFPPGFAVPARLAFGLRRPRRPILGSAHAGVVVACGGRVTALRPGDAVVGMTGLRMGGHATLVAVRADRLARLPEAVSADDAAGVLFGGTAALHLLRRAGVGPIRGASTVLVNGAAGAIGTNAVQLARLRGATVTAVCGPGNADLVRSLGAAEVIDHTTTDVRDVDQRWDVVLDCVGNLSVRSGRRLLRSGGTLALAVAGLRDSVRPRAGVVAGTVPERVEDHRSLLDLVARGDLAVVIDSLHDLDGIVAAHRRVDTGHKVGNVIVRPEGSG